MQRLRLLVLGACLLAAPAFAQEERPPITRQAFKLDPETGCFDYTGPAVEFTGRFRAGSYVGVTMDDPERIPAMDAPEHKTPGSVSWFGPLPESRTYGIMFAPSYLHGSRGHVVICGRTAPP